MERSNPIKKRKSFCRQNVGHVAEQSAVQYLKKKGLSLVCQNYSCHHGEIDLIMKDKDDLVFVEVRYRKNEYFGTPIESIQTQKRKRLIRTAQHYLITHHLEDKPCRFDVIGIQPSSQGYEYEWIEAAFMAEESW